MLQPKRTKYRKAHKGRIHGNAKGGAALNFGAYGLKALTPARITARQIEAARRGRRAQALAGKHEVVVPRNREQFTPANRQ